MLFFEKFILKILDTQEKLKLFLKLLRQFSHKKLPQHVKSILLYLELLKSQ